MVYNSLFLRRAGVVATAAIAGLVAAVAPSSADTLYTFTAGQPNAVYYNTGINFNVGNEVTVGTSPLSVTSIGAFVESSTGSTQAYITGGLTTVAFTAYVYSTVASSNALDTVVIPVGTAVDSQGFAYAPLATTLSPGTQYLLTDAVTGSGAAGTPFALNSADAAAGTFNGAAFVENVYSTAPAGYPNANNGSFQEFMGANLQFAAVPEPASVGLFAVGAVGLLLSRKNKTARN